MALVRKRSGNSFRYYASVFVGEGQPRLSVALGSNEREARKAHEDLMSQYRRGEWRPIKDVRFRVAAERFLKQVWLTRSHATALAYSGYMKRVWVPMLASRRVSTIQPFEIEWWAQAELAKGTGLATVNAALKTAISFGEWCVRHGHLHKNPFKVEVPTPVRKRPRTLDADELRLLLDASKELGALEHAVIALAATAALRKGEVLGLCLDSCLSLHGEDPRVEIRRTVYRRRLREATKTLSSKATVPLCDTARNALADWLLVRPDTDSPLVFCTKDGRPLHDGTPNRILKDALAAAGLPTDRVHYHGLRVSLALLLGTTPGVPPRLTQALLRHSRPDQTLGYQPVTVEHVRVAVDAADAIIAGSEGLDIPF